MKRMMRTWSAVLLLLLAACDKNDPNPGPQEPTTQNKLVDSVVKDADNFTSYTYDATHRITAAVRQWTNQPPGGNTRVEVNYEYNALGALTKMVANGGQTMIYNTGTRPDSMDIFSMNRFVAREYFIVDANGLLVNIRSVNNNRIADPTSPAEVIRDFNYDARGNLAEVATHMLYPNDPTLYTVEKVVYEQFDNSRNPDLYETNYPQFSFWLNNYRKRTTYDRNNQVTQVQHITLQYDGSHIWPVEKRIVTTQGGTSQPAIVERYKYKQ